jgi:threonyl-tRNA synthetase
VQVTTEKKEKYMPEITLPDSSKRKFDSPVSLIDIAKDIGPGLAKATIAGVVNGKEVDSDFVISDDSDVSILTDRSDQGLFIIRHFHGTPDGNGDKTIIPLSASDYWSCH